MAKKKAAKKTTAKPKPKAKAKPQTKKITFWYNLPPDVIKKVVDMCDGHTIFKPEALLNAGVPKDLVKAHTHKYVSDFSDPKATIFDNKTGKPVKEQEGVYGLDVLADIVMHFNLDCRDFFGRGSQAREYARVILEHLDSPPYKAFSKK